MPTKIYVLVTYAKDGRIADLGFSDDLETTQIESGTTCQSGKVKSFDDFQRILRQVEKTLVKGEKAVITLSYTEESEEQKAFERAEIKRIGRRRSHETAFCKA